MSPREADTLLGSATAPAPTGTSQGASCCPVVLVGGFLLPPTADFDVLYWGEAMSSNTRRRVIPVHPSPIASLHDRVCQIFWELKGGQVNYGREHAEEFGHDCLGEVHKQGSYPEWDAGHPVHLVGHSFGGVTVRLLLHYLANGLFEGHDTSADWVVSVTTLNAPHNGTRLVYGLGADPQRPPLVRWGSVGHMLSSVAHVVEFLDLPSLKRAGLTFGLHYWGWSRRKGLLRGAWRVLEVALGYSSLSTTKDNAAYDMTIDAAKQYNQVMTTQPGVYYFSFVGTLPGHPDGAKTLGAASLLKGLAYRLMRSHVQSARCHEHAICQDFPPLQDWCQPGESDGIVSVFSQAFPRLPHEAPHEDGGLPSNLRDLRRGCWYVTRCPVDHVGIVGFPPSRAFQSVFFLSLFEVLDACEEARTNTTTATVTSKERPARRYPWSSVLAALGTTSNDDASSPNPNAMPPAKPSPPPQQATAAPSSSSKAPPSSPPLLTGLLVVAWLASLSLMLLKKPLFLAALAASAACLALHQLAARLLAPSGLCDRSRSLWGLQVVGLLHASTSCLVSAFLLLSELSTQCHSAVDGDRLLTWQLLLSCGYFIFSLFATLRQRLGGRRAGVLAHQALLLTLYTVVLHKDLHLRTTPAATSGGVAIFLRHVLVLTILAEAHTAALLLRDLLLLQGTLPHSPSSFDQPLLSATPPPPPALLAPMWVLLWCSFFLCQAFPTFFLALAFLSRLVLLDALLPSALSWGGHWPTAALLSLLITALLNLDRLKDLSHQYQEDKWGLHLARQASSGRLQPPQPTMAADTQ